MELISLVRKTKDLQEGARQIQRQFHFVLLTDEQLETAVTTISNGMSDGCGGKIRRDKCLQQFHITEEFAARCGLRTIGQKSFSLKAFMSDKTEESQLWVYRACIQILLGKHFCDFNGYADHLFASAESL